MDGVATRKDPRSGRSHAGDVREAETQAIAERQRSPISDTTIMASAGAQIDHVEHVKTQLPYALTVAGICFAVYILAGFVHSSLICLASGTVLILGALLLIKRSLRRQMEN